MFKRKELPYELNALEPFISRETMDYHYNKHHLAYETSLKNNLSDAELPSNIKTLEDLVSNYLSLPKKYHVAVRQFGGGLINHDHYFSILKKDIPFKDGALKKEIENAFESYAIFQEKFIEKAMSVFGSGWTWLVVDRHGKLRIYNTYNQDNPWFLGMKPLIGVDVWEHAYYIDYRNDRKKYLEQIFQILNWDVIEQNYESAMKK